MNVSYGVRAPQSYLDASPEVVAQVVNGCGPGGWKFDIIPDSIWGLSIKEACNIHDWRYTLGQTQADKEAADDEFLLNLITLIVNAKGFSSTALFIPRIVRALTYYEAVKHAGNSAFWHNKIQPEII